MTTAWVLNAVGLFVTSVGALLVFLYLNEAPKFAEQISSDDARTDFRRYQRGVRIAVGLLAAWMVLQDLAVILI